MSRRIVDLSMPVHPDMLTFPRVPPPALCVYESHERVRRAHRRRRIRRGLATAQLPGRAERHVGTTRRAQAHRADGPGAPRRSRSSGATRDGVVLDFRQLEKGHGITAGEVRRSSTASSTAQGDATSS